MVKQNHRLQWLFQTQLPNQKETKWLTQQKAVPLKQHLNYTTSSGFIVSRPYLHYITPPCKVIYKRKYTLKGPL